MSRRSRPGRPRLLPLRSGETRWADVAADGPRPARPRPPPRARERPGRPSRRARPGGRPSARAGRVVGPGTATRPRRPAPGESAPRRSCKRSAATAGTVRSTFGRVPGGTRAAMRRRQRAPRPAAIRARTATPSEPRCASEVALALGRSWPVLPKSAVRYRRCGAWVTDQHEEICPACLQLAASSPSIRRVRHLALPPDLMNSENSSGRTLKPSVSSAAASLGAP